MILIEIEAAVDAAGSVETFYLSTQGFQTEPDDATANRAFDDDLIEPGSLGISTYADGTTGGASRLQAGEIQVNNVDGAYDVWRRYGFDARPATIRSGPEGGRYPADYPVVIIGAMESVEVDWNTATLRFRDLSFIFDSEVLTTLYAGTNVGPVGLEGTVDDLKGKPKPYLMGSVKNISPPCVNTSKLTFQVSKGPVASIVVYDRGVALTASTNQTTSAALTAATVTSGTYQTCLAEGLFRLGATPAGEITADVAESLTDANMTTAQLLKRLAIMAGVGVDQVIASDVSILDTLNSAVVGIWISGGETYRQVMDGLSSSIGAYYSFGPTGTFSIGQLREPTGSSVATILEDDIEGEPSRRPASDNGIPVWSVDVSYAQNYTPQTSDLAGAVTAARRAFLKEEFRTANDNSAAIKTQFRLAGKLDIQTCLRDAAAAQAEATRQLDLHGVPRDIFDVPISLDFLVTEQLKLMSEVTLVLDRFNLDAGQNFLIIGIQIELADESAVLTLWG